MKIFEMPLPVRAQRFRNEFKWIAGALGEVRDLDVQLARLDSWISSASSGDKEPLEALRAVFQERRKKARRLMLPKARLPPLCPSCRVVRGVSGRMAIPSGASLATTNTSRRP